MFCNDTCCPFESGCLGPPGASPLPRTPSRKARAASVLRYVSQKGAELKVEPKPRSVWERRKKGEEKFCQKNIIIFFPGNQHQILYRFLFCRYGEHAGQYDRKLLRYLQLQ